VLFGNADIKGARWKLFLEEIDAGTRRHGSGDRDDATVFLRLGDQRLAEDLLIGGRLGVGFLLLAGEHVELGDAVILVGTGFGRCIALAFLGHDVNQDRTVSHVANILEDGNQVIEVVPVDRTDIVEAEFLEQGSAGDHAAGEFFRALRADLHRARQVARDAFSQIAQAPVGVARNQPGEIGAHRADRRGNRHVVVIEDHDQARIHRAGIVHRLIGHARAHRAVADDGDDVVVLTLEIARDREAETGRDGGRGMRGTECVIFALGALGEAG